MPADRSSPSWERFASREPYFAVLTDSRYLRATFEGAARAEFFESGTRYVEFVLDAIRNRITPMRRPESVLELGCGPGRLALAFANVAASVTAVDISPAMLRVARENAAAAGAENVHFETLDEFRLGEAQFDLVNATLVFHHVPPRDGYSLIAEMLRRLKPGGVAAIEFPFRVHSGFAGRATRWARRHIPPLNAAANVVRGKPRFFPLIHPRPYSASEVLSLIQAAGCDRPHLVLGRHGATEVVTVFAQEPVVVREESRLQSQGGIDVRKLIAETSIEEL